MTAGPVDPSAQSRVVLRPLAGSSGPGAVRIRGGFWGRLQQLNRAVTIPHGIAMLEESGSLENLRMAASLQPGRNQRRGTPQSGSYALPLFRDSDVWKTLEAIAWERWHGPDPGHERFFADAVGLAQAAQRPDGYLNSHTEVVLGGRRFGDPAMGHELYCAGHLLQAAVADLRTADVPGSRQAGRGSSRHAGNGSSRDAGNGSPLAAVAGRFADLIGKELHGELADYVPGHPEIEPALVEFGRATGRPELTGYAAELISRRGAGALSWHSFGPAYFSDDVPFAQAEEVRGHAVRALYLACGAVDVHTETGTPDLLRAALAQWDDMITGKTYLTGGVGSRHKDEAFGAPFELPPDRAYCETCAAIASVMWNWRLLLVTGQSRFADLMERTLLNGFLAGLGLDGRSFFYVNPLHAREPTQRQPWYTCACCPPNIMRLLASLDHYVATVTSDGVQLHQFASGQLRAELPAAGALAAAIETGLPHEGWVWLRVTEAPGGQAELAIRMPPWASTVHFRRNGHPVQIEPGQDGYLRLKTQWSAGDEVTAEFGLEVRAVRADPRADAVRGCVAFERGPLVYCVESTGLPGPSRLEDVTVAARAVRTTEIGIAGHRVPALILPGLLRPASPPQPWPVQWPYRDAAPAASQAARAGQPADAGNSGDRAAERIDLAAVPYYTWANRGPATMRVWLPEHR